MKIGGDRYNSESIEDLKRYFQDEIDKLEEAVNKNISKHLLRILKSQFPDTCNFLTKILTCF